MRKARNFNISFAPLIVIDDPRIVDGYCLLFLSVFPLMHYIESQYLTLSLPSSSQSLNYPLRKIF